VLILVGVISIGGVLFIVHRMSSEAGFPPSDGTRGGETGLREP
jgi:hypothetical protein